MSELPRRRALNPLLTPIALSPAHATATGLTQDAQDTLRARAANRRNRMSTADHQRLADHPDPLVRMFWVQTAWRVPAEVVQYRLRVEADSQILSELIELRPEGCDPTALARAFSLGGHPRTHALLHPRCPPELVERFIATDLAGHDLHSCSALAPYSVAQGISTLLRSHPAALGALIRHVAPDALGPLAHLAGPLMTAPFGIMLLRRLHSSPHHSRSTDLLGFLRRQPELLQDPSLWWDLPTPVAELSSLPAVNPGRGLTHYRGLQLKLWPWDRSSALLSEVLTAFIADPVQRDLHLALAPGFDGTLSELSALVAYASC